MDLEELIREFLPSKNVLQLATSVNNQPWVCNVHYYSDDDLNMYWISTPQRRHSEEIKQNPRVAVVIKVHENTPNENYIIGLSAEGTAELAGRDLGQINEAYMKKLDKPAQLMADIKDGSNPHEFYKFSPTKFVLFDTKNFPKEPRQEWKIEK